MTIRAVRWSLAIKLYSEVKTVARRNFFFAAFTLVAFFFNVEQVKVAVVVVYVPCKQVEYTMHIYTVPG